MLESDWKNNIDQVTFIGYPITMERDDYGNKLPRRTDKAITGHRLIRGILSSNVEI